MENTEVMNEVVETAVEDGAEKVVEVSGSKVGIAVGAILAGALVGGYFYYKKKKAKKEAITVEATEVKTEEKKDSEEPKEN